MSDCERYVSEGFLEFLYNHKRTCEMVLRGDAKAAKAQIRRQTVYLQANNQAERYELRNIFLTSLNRSLYTFILYSLDLSLAACCYENRRHLHREQDVTSFLACADAIVDSYVAHVNVAPSNTQHIEKACQYIQRHLQEDLTLERVAANGYISKCYLCQMFKPVTGRTFSEYVTQQRMIRARNLLLTTDEAIVRIAECCGYRTAAYFSTAFKKEAGMTPKAFRQTFREAASPD